MTDPVTGPASEARNYGSAEEGVATIERLVAQAQERAARAQELSAEMDRLRLTGQSRDGSAQVTVTQTGAVVDVFLDEQRLGQAPLSQVRAAILEANAAAQGQIAPTVQALSVEAFGEDSETAARFGEQYREMFPPADGGDDGPAEDAGVLR